MTPSLQPFGHVVHVRCGRPECRADAEALAHPGLSLTSPADTPTKCSHPIQGEIDMQITRRRFGLAAFGGVLLPAVPALSKAPVSGAQVPGVYRQKVGAFEVTVLSDGWLPIETKIFSGDPASAEKLLENAFLPKDATPTAVNEWLVNTGDKLVLI